MRSARIARAKEKNKSNAKLYSRIYSGGRPPQFEYDWGTRCTASLRVHQTPPEVRARPERCQASGGASRRREKPTPRRGPRRPWFEHDPSVGGPPLDDYHLSQRLARSPPPMVRARPDRWRSGTHSPACLRAASLDRACGAGTHWGFSRPGFGRAGSCATARGTTGSSELKC